MQTMSTTSVLAVLVFTLVIAAAVPGTEAQDGPCTCADVAPPGDLSCEKQKDLGKCSRSWMIENDYCTMTCERCPCAEESDALPEPSKPKAEGGCGECVDISPSTDLSCQEQATLGKCERSWMEGFCLKSCNKCSCATPSKNPAGGGGGGGGGGLLAVKALLKALVAENKEASATTGGEATAGEEVTDTGSEAPTEKENPAVSDDSTEQRQVNEGSAGAGGETTEENADTGATESEVQVDQTPATTETTDGSSQAAQTAGEEMTTTDVETEVNNVETAEQDMPSSDGQTQDSSIASGGESGGTERIDSSIPWSPPVQFGIDDGEEQGEEIEENGGESMEESGQEKCQTIMSVISNNPDLTALADAIRTARIALSLEDTTVDITFFAPSNQAFQTFAGILGGDAEAAGNSPNVMKLILSNHASRPARRADDLVNTGTLTTLSVIQGERSQLKVTRNSEGQVVIDGNVNRARIVTSDIQACGGVVHIIDAVLPQVPYGEVITAL